MSNWSKMVAVLQDEGYTPEEIVARIALPLVTLTFVNNAIAQRTSFKKSRYQAIRKQTVVPAEGTLARKVHDNVQALGGHEMLKVKLQSTSYRKLAREWSVPFTAVANSIRNFFRVTYYLGTFQHNYYVTSRRARRANRRMTRKEARNLW